MKLSRKDALRSIMKTLTRDEWNSFSKERQEKIIRDMQAAYERGYEDGQDSADRRKGWRDN